MTSHAGFSEEPLLNSQVLWPQLLSVCCDAHQTYIKVFRKSHFKERNKCLPPALQKSMVGATRRRGIKSSGGHSVTSCVCVYRFCPLTSPPLRSICPRRIETWQRGMPASGLFLQACWKKEGPCVTHHCLSWRWIKLPIVVDKVTLVPLFLLVQFRLHLKLLQEPEQQQHGKVSISGYHHYYKYCP